MVREHKWAISSGGGDPTPNNSEKQSIEFPRRVKKIFHVQARVVSKIGVAIWVSRRPPIPCTRGRVPGPDHILRGGGAKYRTTLPQGRGRCWWAREWSGWPSRGPSSSPGASLPWGVGDGLLQGGGDGWASRNPPPGGETPRFSPRARLFLKMFYICFLGLCFFGSSGTLPPGYP